MDPCENGVQTISKSLGKRIKNVTDLANKEEKLHESTLVGELGEGERGGIPLRDQVSKQKRKSEDDFGTSNKVQTLSSFRSGRE
jgi:hypothetical protein